LLPWSGRAAQEVGPKRGSLVIVGGGGGLGEAGIWRRFLDLAGGNEGVDRRHSDRG
jgi:hypothetical protein